MKLGQQDSPAHFYDGSREFSGRPSGNIDYSQVENPAEQKEKHLNTEFTKTMSSKEYEAYKEKSGHMWATLPDSVIGTLIYFLMVEHNDKEFDFLVVLKCLLLIGFPVYFTYLIQGVIVYSLWNYLPNFSDDNSLCDNDIKLELAVIAVFFIYLFPSIHSILKESMIVLRGEAVCFTHAEDDDLLKVG